MRVLIANKFWYRRGGAEIVAMAHESLLAERGHDVVHLAMQHPDNEPSDRPGALVSNVEFEGLSAQAFVRPFWSREVAERVTELVRDHAPEVALLHNTYHQLGAALVATLDRLGVPMVMVLHDQKPVCPMYWGMRDGRPCSKCRGGRFQHAALHGCGGSRARGALLSAEAFWAWRVARVYQRIDAYASPSEWLVGRCAEMGFPYFIEHLRNPTAPARLQASPATSRVLGFVGRISQEKGVDLLCAAAEHVPNLTIEIVGDGPDRARLEASSPSNVRFLGRRGAAQIGELRAGWRAAVVSSVWLENAPLVAVEAMAAGLGVVTTDRGGTRELVGDAGIVAQADARSLGLAMARVGSDDNLARELGERARKRAKAYEPEVVANDVEALLERTIRLRRGETAQPEASSPES